METMTTYRSETEGLRAHVVELEDEISELKGSKADLEVANARLRRQEGPSWWMIVGYGAVGSAVTILATFFGQRLTAPSPPTQPEEPTALVIHNAWCYRAHDLNYMTDSLRWSTQSGTRMSASYENVTIVVPRDTTSSGWDAAYMDALIADPRECNN